MRQTGLQKKLDLCALILSLVFNPAVLFCIFLVSVIVTLSANRVSQVLSLEILILIWLIPLAMSIYYLRKFNFVTDWSLSQLPERQVFNLVAMFWGLVTFLAAASFQLGSLVNYLGLVLLWLAIFALITLRWKISAHTSALTLVLLIFYQLTGRFLFPGLIVVFLVSWARLRRKKHTVWEIIGGIIYSLLGVMLLAYFS